MWDYTDKVMEHFYHPRNQGAISASNEGEAITIGDVGSISCGDALRLYLKIDIATDSIITASFQTFGCASAIASSSALTELLKGQTLDEALKITNREIADFLGGLPEAKMHCSVMGQEALEAAIFNYRGIPLDNHEEDEGALVCSCFGISDAKIRRVILENELETAEQVTNYIKAGGGCGSCLADIDDLLYSIAAEKANTIARTTEVVNNYATLTTVQKINRIQQVLEEIRPTLIADGGDLELLDLEGDVVKLVLKGACGSCSSSTITLKMGIEAKLREKVLSTLVVEAV
ncbi:MAG: Fe-S cluster assembly protein NifU [Gloeocapsa sp. DLM2.Bin57]|nr:MAG: Fe-S cluster assembly protein NifU [Gloeocapsa sp. DLM2.Bin57]